MRASPEPEPAELPLEASTEFLSGNKYLGYHQKQLQGDQLAPWQEPSSDFTLRASPGPCVYETLAELSLADSPVKRLPPQPPALLHGFSPAAADPPPLAHSRRASQAGELEAANAVLSRRVEELQERLAAAEKAAAEKEAQGGLRPPAAAGAHSPDPQELRELQARLTSKQREAAAAHQALDRARAEAKQHEAQLQQERSRAAGLLDEVAQWRDEYHKMKTECLALHRKLEATIAQGSLLDGNMGALKKQNSELLKALAEQEAASRGLHEKMHALQGQGGSRQKQLQQLLAQIEAVESENSELRQQLHEASVEECSRRGQLQQLWDERERLHSENASLRQQVQDLNAELHHMGEAFAVLRAEMRQRTSREGSMVGERPPVQQYPAQPGPSLPQAALAACYQVSRPATSGAQQMRKWGLPNNAMNEQRLGSYGVAGASSQQWAGWQQEARAVSSDVAAAHEAWRQRGLKEAGRGGREPAPAPAAQRSLTFEVQQGAFDPQPLLSREPSWGSSREAEAAAAPSLSPAEGFNPRASFPQPYNPGQPLRGGTGAATLKEEEGSLLLRSTDLTPKSDMGAIGPGVAGGIQGRPRLSSSGDGAGGSAIKPQGSAVSPFGNDIDLSEMLARTQALESRLMELGMEKNELEAESVRMPTSMAGRKLQLRKRKEEVAQRLEAVNREMSNIRLQLKKMGYK